MVPAAVGTFEDFYRIQVDRVYRALVLTLRDQDLAREATDEAMTRAYARWDAVSALENPGGWAYRVGLNWATSWWRRRRRELPLSTMDERVAANPGPVGDTMRALAGLPAGARAVVMCRVLLDLSTAQTAQVLGVAEGTVKSRLARAPAALRRGIDEEGERD